MFFRGRLQAGWACCAFAQGTLSFAYMKINTGLRAQHQNPFGHNDHDKRMWEDLGDTHTHILYTWAHQLPSCLWWIKNKWFLWNEKLNEVGWRVHVELEKQQQQVAGWLAAAGDNQVFHNAANWQLHSTWWFTVQLVCLCVAALLCLTHYDRLSRINEFSMWQATFRFFCMISHATWC